MDIISVYSNKANVKEAVGEIKDQLDNSDIKMLLFFASSALEPVEISREMQAVFPGSLVCGCSTSGEIVSGKMLKNSLVAMALSSSIIEDVKIEVVENISQDCDVQKAFASLSAYFGVAMAQADINQFCGIVLADGLSAAEEKLMDKIGDQTNCTIIGGSAGDDLKFQKTSVYANGRVYSDAAVLAVLKLKNGFDIIKTQSFIVLDKKFVATKVDTAARKVIEFDGLPAVEAYAGALGVPKDKAAEYFMTNPVGLVIEDDIFVRSPQRIDGEGIVFYCNILEDMEVSLLQSKNIIIDTKTALENKKAEIGSLAGIINFNCILRTLELEQKNQTEAYGKLFADIPTIGFSTYGEEYLGHINQTATMLVFK